MEEFGIDQNRYVQQVRQMMLRPACVRAHFSAADERIAIALYRHGITLVHLQRAIWLGCARKYAALLNGSESAPMYITRLHYFAGIVKEVEAAPVGVDYWKHIENKVGRFEQMWIDWSRSCSILPGDLRSDGAPKLAEYCSGRCWAAL